MESEEDPDESFNFIATLFDRLLADVSSKKKPKPPKSFLDENTYMLCKVVDYELGESALTNALEGDDLEHLRLLPQLFDNYLRIHPGTLPTEVIIWTISKILLMLSSPMLYDRLGGLYQEHLIALCQYLSAEAKNFLLKQTIVALCEITKGSENVCLKACEGGNEAAGEVKCPKGSIKLVPVTIAISELNENRSLLQNCLLDLIQHGGFDLNYLDECHLLQVAWRALLPLIETSAPTLKNKCILAVQRLVSLDLCNRFMAEALLRRLMAIENRLIEVIDADEDVVRLEESLATCQQTFASCLRKFATLRTFEDLGLENLIEWAVLLLEICRKQPLPKERLINFLAALCSILSRLNGVDEGFLDGIAQLANDITLIVQTLVVRNVVISVGQLADLFSFIFTVDKWTSSGILSRLNGVDEGFLDGIAQLANDITLIVQTLVVRNVVISVGQLADLFSFIFTVDKWTSSGVSGQEVVRIVCNAKEKFVGTEVVKAIRVQQLIISAVKRAKNGEAVLLQIIPHSDELLQVLKTVSTMESDGDEVLLSLIELISTLIDCAEQEQINWIALLSLPWLTEPIDCSRHKRSIPLLAEIRRLVAASAKSCTVEVKRSTISAIARMQCTSEWRRIIFTYALESLDVKLQRAALEHFANFVHSTDIYAFNILLDKILFLATSAIRRDGGAEICATVLKAVAISLCTVDTKKMLAEGEVCSVCSQEVVTTQKMKMDPSKLLYLFETVACYEDKELRLAYCAALQSTLKHVQFHSKDTLESAVQKSLVLMGDLDEDVRADYELCFKQIIHMQWNKLYSDIGIKLSDLEVEGKQIAHLQYTLTCAQHAADADLANNCFVKIILLAVHSSSPNAISAARKLIQSELAKSEPTITPQQLFLRKKAQICKYLARNLVTITYNNGSVQRDEVHLDGDVVKRLKDEAQEAFAVMAELFGYQREDGWLSDASGELVPSVILAKGAFPEAIVGVLEKVLEMRRLRASALISECFPSLLIHLISSKSSSEIIRKTFRFIEHFTQGECTWLDLMSSKVYGCTVIVLQHLSMNENLCMDNLKRLHRIANGEDAPFVFTNFIEQRYLGVLLHFRPAFTDDHFYSERALIASSLCCMMRKIYEEGTNFLDTTATKMLAVLRVLTPLGELSIEPWKTFVETLSDEALLGLLPQILVSIAPLLKFNEARSILSFIFTTKRLQLSSNLEFERISLMLWNNPKVHINEFLSSEHKSAPLSKVLGACASLLKESNEEVSELVLHKVFSVLEGTCWDDDRSFDNIAAQLVCFVFNLYSLADKQHLVFLSASRSVYFITFDELF
ncbi:hypothetical protein Tcan_17961 [Toxocara canis]|uniref:Uncharacterized protein n=1 Tax=Toxocara canis TaxID=6265 RepID=A0A0B2VHN6_TOXCA|nr:hypothetical protein Tcan_17961 [Toxocara canis]